MDTLCRYLIERWISENPPFTGNGWEPYCLSLRVVNWVKWLSCQEENRVDSEWLKSLALQTSALEQQIEYHILGNHLFANAKALVFAGCFFGGSQGDAWLEKGLKLLCSQLDEQFLEDGGHYERSPMYHAILLWDVCDLLRLFEQSQLGILNNRSAQLRNILKIGMVWLSKMVHPDGGIAFFNDATFGIAPTLEHLQRYCSNLRVIVGEEFNNEESWSETHLKSSGYIIVDHSKGHRALLNMAEIGPVYQPGHAHADTLSFELSLFGQRLFVNSGTSQYGTGSEREYQRGTRAHNTVEVEDENSSETWAGFRVARRAKPFNVAVSTDDKALRVVASHDGYYRLPGKVYTQRTWIFEDNAIKVVDLLSGNWSKAVSRFYCHPSIIATQVKEFEILLTLPFGQKVRFTVEGASELRLVDSDWHPGFGVSSPNRCIEVVLFSPELISRVDFQSF
ncbi:heparinase II/III family protein [Aurantivibrio plasticivorans]